MIKRDHRIDLYLMLIGAALTALTLVFPRIGFLQWVTMVPMILAACRFFDQDIGVLYRSAGFVLLGLGFITANAIYLKRRAK